MILLNMGSAQKVDICYAPTLTQKIHDVVADQLFVKPGSFRWKHWSCIGFQLRVFCELNSTFSRKKVTLRSAQGPCAGDMVSCPSETTSSPIMAASCKVAYICCSTVFLRYPSVDLDTLFEVRSNIQAEEVVLRARLFANLSHVGLRLADATQVSNALGHDSNAPNRGQQKG